MFVRGLIVDAIIGIHPWERENLQPVKISFAMATDTRGAAREDAIEQALDYSAASERVAGATGSRWARRSWSSSANSSPRQASLRCHLT